MDKIDGQLLTLIQRDFPVTSRPYAFLGDQLGLSEADVITRISNLKNQGFIRRVGGVFDSRKLGYTSTLCALKVPENRIHQVKQIINEIPGVTHNYLRNHEYNMWFTLIAPSNEVIVDTLTSLKLKTNLDQLMNLPATQFFKINVHFKLQEGS
ncbi:putative transcriptional regulator, AsnC family [Alkaliphilus metalliredigens QYMF]|uniref:siroheme decarboxylase n=1 Tax=Alkaliphilus metalliredigens (strain QYMF) TaxID=293826 RepID=A6TJC5_ALKMQ|nr:AsnC family transcriptional regulator [Alkaliphilus metalliredigens]ABR46293.1 putative transcriptional regulator, AsnC family [Alkaliphilus metalliredigens QYMF]